MTKIYFFSTAGKGTPFTDTKLKALIKGGDAWRGEGKQWTYGMCIPQADVDPDDVVARLKAMGVYVLAPINDLVTTHPALANFLADHGIAATDTAIDIVRKMHAIHGKPHMKPPSKYEGV